MIIEYLRDSEPVARFDGVTLEWIFLGGSSWIPKAAINRKATPMNHTTIISFLRRRSPISWVFSLLDHIDMTTDTDYGSFPGNRFYHLITYAYYAKLSSKFEEILAEYLTIQETRDYD